MLLAAFRPPHCDMRDLRSGGMTRAFCVYAAGISAQVWLIWTWIRRYLLFIRRKGWSSGPTRRVWRWTALTTSPGARPGIKNPWQARAEQQRWNAGRRSFLTHCVMMCFLDSSGLFTPVADELSKMDARPPWPVSDRVAQQIPRAW